MHLSYRLPIIHSQLLNHLKKAFDKYSKYYNMRTRAISYTPGTLYHLSDKFNHFSTKLAPLYKNTVIRYRAGKVNWKTSIGNWLVNTMLRTWKSEMIKMIQMKITKSHDIFFIYACWKRHTRSCLILV